MRLKTSNKSKGRNSSTANASSNVSSSSSRNNKNSNNDDLNGSTSSNGSNDLEMDSGDDEIDVGTNADSVGFNGSNSNSSNSATTKNVTNSSPNDNSIVMSNGVNNDEFNGFDFRQQQNQQTTGSMSEADRKRAHHNALERKRRDHIKDSFHTLRDAIPNIKGEKISTTKTSRAQILKAATDYIKIIRNRNVDYQHDIDSLKKQNNDIENQIRQLEKAKQFLKQQQNESLQPKLEPGIYANNDCDAFAPSAASSSSLIIKNEYSNDSPTLSTSNINLNTNQLAATANNVLFITKPSITTTKKFKTIINPKSSLNIINMSSNNNVNSFNLNTLHNNNNNNIASNEKDLL